jgi:23S rRNA (adenine2030-N6)-methyltransferase
MLSYRHAFHAGNHADVLKHYVFSLVLDYFNQKDKPYWVVDTHAGAGMYALGDAYAQKNAEFENGITRLFAAKDLPESLENFVKIIKNFNENNALDFYPGSPKIAESLLRSDDKLRLFELHPSDCKLLIENFSGKGKQTKIELLDGFAGIKACLPPPSKRAVILIDPPYELKEDYQRVVDCVKDSLNRFATGTYMVWYPLLQRDEPLDMGYALKAMQANNWLDISLSVATANADGFGMFGSGMFIINPPWTLPKMLEEAMPILRDLLALDSGASFTLQHNIS